jgi:hypothetical protein
MDTYDSSDTLSVGDYPSPDDNAQEINGYVTIRFKLDGEMFPEKWTTEDIIQYINENPTEFTDEVDEVLDIEI